MRFVSCVEESFEASHQVPGHSVCGERHGGHVWKVVVGVEGGLDPKTIQVVDHADLAKALHRVVREIRGRHLNDMLPGVIPTPEGVGLYIRERMILEWPRISFVSVEMGGWSKVEISGDIR